MNFRTFAHKIYISKVMNVLMHTNMTSYFSKALKAVCRSKSDHLILPNVLKYRYLESN